MIALGLTNSPLEICGVFDERNIKYNVNEVGRHKISVFTGLEAFTQIRKQTVPRRILIFDTLERLLMVQNLNVVNNKNVKKAADSVLNWTATSAPLTIKNRDYVLEIIEENKNDNSFLHTYNTNLYGITFPPARDAIRDVYLSYLNGSITKEKFDVEIKKVYPKRGKSLESAEVLMELTETDLFKRMQQAIQLCLKQKKTGKDVDEIALKKEVAAFDLRYFLSTLTSKIKT